jgi:hypothetical protein
MACEVPLVCIYFPKTIPSAKIKAVSLGILA